MWFIVIGQAKCDSNTVYYFSDPTNEGCCFAIPLPHSADFAKINIISTNAVMNGKQDVLKQPKANTDLLYFSALSYYKSSVETNFPILLSYFRIRIVVLTCPDNKSARNYQPKLCVPEKSDKI